MGKIKPWLKAFRLRTLPLAFSSVILGSFLAAYKGSFDWVILLGALLTTLFLQILSNLANDYGDTIHGVDNHQRVGPARSVQSGEISLKKMKWAVVIFTLLSLTSGVWLTIKAMSGLDISNGIILLIIGLFAIAAAIKYTIGKKPYGYIGLGDFAVFLFFGLTGVMGTYFLHTHQITPVEFLPAISIGLLSAGVLNLNNLRDRVNDSANNKITMVVKLGVRKSKIYHAFLIITGMASSIIYVLVNAESLTQWIFVLTFPLLIKNIVVVFKNNEPSLLDPELKKLAITTLLFALTLGIGLIL